MFGQTEINYIVGNCGRFARCDGPPHPAGRRPPMGRASRPPRRGDRRRPRDMPARHAGRRGGAPARRARPPQTRRSSSATGRTTGHARQVPAATRRGSCRRTGDTAVMDGDGYLWYQGRSDDVFKAAGYRIRPSEVENCLVKDTRGANAAVVPKWPDKERGAAPWSRPTWCWRGLRAGRCAGGGSQRAELRGKLAPYEYPKEIEFIAALPMVHHHRQGCACASGAVPNHHAREGGTGFPALRAVGCSLNAAHPCSPSLTPPAADSAVLPTGRHTVRMKTLLPSPAARVAPTAPDRVATSARR